MQPNRLDLLKIAQVQDVQLRKGQDIIVGTLHLTVHHLIFKHSEELWSGRHPLVIRCRDFTMFTLGLLKEGEAQDVFDTIQKLACVSSVEQLYAYTFQPEVPFTTENGWNIYDPIKEYERMGIGASDKWRFTVINRDYKYSPTYPRILVVPSKISDAVLTHAAKYRSKARIPTLSYLHWYNNATITRSSQPLVGFKQARSIQDEKLIESIFSSNVPTGPNGETVYGSTAANLIVDARPMANAVGNVARGAGTENMDHYRNCKKIYVAIDNIHVMRDSLAKLCEAMQGVNNIVNKVALQKSGWLKHISTLIDGTREIVKSVHVYNSHVLVHCSDGWDRTSQMVSLSELCLDPYYRTFEGFQVLIEKDWVSFGHKFQDRCGHLTNERFFINNNDNTTASSFRDKFYYNNHQKETSPIFHQFLDCVYQLLCLYPTRFEFNQELLLELHYHLYSCQFGTFLFNSEQERNQYKPQDKTFSIWDYLNTHKSRFINEFYDPMKDKDLVDDGGVLLPDSTRVKYWATLFKRNDDEVNSVISPENTYK
ncbi:hypothetical protein G6F70_006139 [Rhizopus microsporus]|nr:hypothetical protein G6F71_005995 [Rhizopus microsporus]KAG1198035.1 hypothetical protein G6F70_006139 [Rhizopus microsporus]KAG1209778.1 hypothetical protein G6F69_006051 [Rhizopus microsporus]KAG1231435.1 hypothetical protein G6F67_005747 [Rhizopus microsporus]KAG1263744.1 hypothetical protein G6F68_004897 [Rhizopus microsporus]